MRETRPLNSEAGLEKTPHSGYTCAVTIVVIFDFTMHLKERS